jgi:acyl-coenzyme A synthetase/AMP-(fatty) acid ligase
MAFPLIDVIERHAAANPLAPALAGLAGTITYSELFDRIVRLTSYFDDLGLPRLGRALLNIANPDLRMTVMLAATDYGLIVLLAQPSTLRGDYDWDLVIGSSEPIWPDVPADVVIDPSLFTGPVAYSRRRYFPERGGGDLSYVVETSGTTGRPKLIAVDHAFHTRSSTRARMGSNASYDTFSAADRSLTTIGGATRVGIGLYEYTLNAGGVSVSVPFEPLTFLRLVNLFRVTRVATTPRFIEEAMNLMEEKGIRCDTVRVIRLTGALFSRALLQRLDAWFPNAQKWVGYGSTEVMGTVAGGVITQATFTKGYVGQINTDLQFVSTGSEANPGRVTLINDHVNFTKYIKDDRIFQYEGKFIEIPDLGYIKDGGLYLLGRADEVYNFSGIIKAYALIEEAIARLADIKEAAVVSGAALGDELNLVIGVVADEPLDLNLLGDRIAESLGMVRARPYFKLCQVKEIRRTRAGKVDRGQLVRDYQESIGVNA